MAASTEGMGRGVRVTGKGGEYTLANDEDFSIFADFCNSAAGWDEVYRDDKTTTTVFRKPTDNSSINMFKLTRTMTDVQPEVLYDVLHDHNYRKVWDDNMIEGIVIEQLDATNEVGYYGARSPSPVGNRDFVNQRCWRAEPDKGVWVIMNWSVPHSEYPPKKDFTRAQSILSGYQIRKNPSGAGSLFTYVTQTDPKGWIPSWVVNTVAGKLAPRVSQTLHTVSLAYPEWKKDHRPDWKPWIDGKFD